MSFGLPPLIPKPELPAEFNVKEDSLGISHPMISGLSASQQIMGYSHPLEFSERNFEQHQIGLNMTMMRNTQGLHAPLRLAMELKAANKIGRLPFLPSSNVMRDIILGKDEDIGFEDILNTHEFKEVAGQPHAMVEKSLGIL